MWTINEIKEWLKGKRESNRQKIRKETDAMYKKEHNEKMQKLEDDAWERDIKYRAENMLRERNTYIERNQLLEKMGKVPVGWGKHEPLLIPPLGRSAVYTIHDYDTARYLKVSIEDLVWNKFKELKEITNGTDK